MAKALNVQNIFASVTRSQVTEDRMNAFEEALSDPTALAEFRKNAEKTSEFLQALYGTSERGRKLALSFLSAPYAIWGLAGNGQAGAVMAIINASETTHEQKMQVLSAPRAIQGLANNDQAKAVMVIITALETTHEQKVQMLSVQNAIMGLADNGQAEAVMAIINAPETTYEQKVQMLIAPNARGLANNGQAAAVQQITDSEAYEQALEAYRAKMAAAQAPSPGAVTPRAPMRRVQQKLIDNPEHVKM